MKTKKLVLFGLGLFLVLWSVCSALGFSSFGSWVMPILVGVILISLTFPELLSKKWKSFGPYPIGRHAKEELMKAIADEETKILNKMDILVTLFFPLSIVIGIIIVTLLKQPVEDPRLIIEHDAKIVISIIVTLVIYLTILTIGYLIRRSWSKELDESWENKKHLSFAISISK